MSRPVWTERRAGRAARSAPPHRCAERPAGRGASTTLPSHPCSLWYAAPPIFIQPKTLPPPFSWNGYKKTNKIPVLLRTFQTKRNETVLLGKPHEDFEF